MRWIRNIACLLVCVTLLVTNAESRDPFFPDFSFDVTPGFNKVRARRGGAGEPGAKLEPFWTEPSRYTARKPIPITSELYARLADSLSPSVVNIFTRVKIGGIGDPLGIIFVPLPIPVPGGGIPGLGREARSLGSGFIISKDGYVLTNAHVVRNASEIEVFLQNSNEAVKATVVGVQPIIDIAVLRIPAADDLVVAPLGDSDEVRMGDFILAIGNPFGLRHTLTTGNVSAVDRRVPMSRKRSFPQGFIQIDAPINPGNSGGPLINLNGEVVGINTAIYSSSGGSIGLGFAAPINYSKELLPRLRRYGYANLAIIGIQHGEVTQAIAKSKKLIGKARGALALKVLEDRPAMRSGMHDGDIILSFNNKPIANHRALSWTVLTSLPGEQVPVVVWRDGAEKKLHITPAKYR